MPQEYDLKLILEDAREMSFNEWYKKWGPQIEEAKEMSFNEWYKKWGPQLSHAFSQIQMENYNIEEMVEIGIDLKIFKKPLGVEE